MRTAELREEDTVHEFTSGSGDATTAGGRAGYAEWIALGAVVAGTIGAIVGAARCANGGRHVGAIDRPESAMLTAPHGDKLWPARE